MNEEKIISVSIDDTYIIDWEELTELYFEYDKKNSIKEEGNGKRKIIFRGQ